MTIDEENHIRNLLNNTSNESHWTLVAKAMLSNLAANQPLLKYVIIDRVIPIVQTKHLGSSEVHMDIFLTMFKTMDSLGLELRPRDKDD